jgi:hypothetical protein
MSSPAISVVMSVYNGEKFLIEAIDSILGQTFADFEFIIIDDGSTDSTSKILSDYAKRDERVRVFAQENRGRAESLNCGIDRARAPLIARMDADDISLPHRLEQQLEFMKTHSEIGLLGGAAELVSPGKIKFGVHQPPIDDGEIRQALLSSNPFFHPTLVLRKDIVREVGGYRKALMDADDYDLILRMAERSKVANIASCVLLYRIHSNQVSVRAMTHQKECVLAARAAAILRNSGAADPLSGIARITSGLMQSLGITREQIRHAEFEGCRYWINLLVHVDSDSVLRLVDRLSVLCNSTRSERIVVADRLMLAASIQYHRRDLGQALAYLCRALLIEPTMAGRHIRMAFARRAHSFRPVS